MCLLKSNDRSSVCNHEECKQLSMVNRQGCLFSLKHPKNQDMFANPFNLIQPSQLHDPKAHVSPQQYHNTQPVNHRGVEKVTHEIDRDDEPFVLNKKKFKADDSHASSADARTRNTIFTPYQSSHSGSNQADRMVFNKPLLNNLLINANNSVEQKQPNVQYVPINQPIYMPLMQGNGVQTPNLMGNQQIAFIQVPQNTQMPVQNIAQQFKTRANEPMGGYFSPSKSNSNSNSSGENSSIEEMMRSMQEKLTEMLFTQNKMITDLREKNELVQDTLACLINEVCDLKQVVKKNSGTTKGFDGYDPKPLLLQTGVADSGRETANTDSLLNFLYAGKQDFQYQLVFKNELPLPLYRERNFKFTVLLTDKDGNVVKNANRIPLTLAMYTSENPPKFIDVNTAGNKVLKGMIDRDLVDGVARFDKIQINEVTSHFRNGWVFFVVYAKNSGVVLNNFVANNGMAAISHQQIKPLIMEKIVVKAKRAKEREQNAQQDELDNKDELNCHNNMMFEMRPELEDHSNIFIQTEN